MTSLLVRLFIKNYKNVNDAKVRSSYGTFGSILGVVCNLVLCVIKITVGFVIGSISVIADGFNNLSDIGSSVVTVIGFKMASKPADSDHPFGHGRMEYISAFAVCVLIFFVGIELLKSSIKALVSGQAAPEYSIFAIIILAVTVLIKLYMFVSVRKIGKTIRSDALIAASQDSLNDSVTTSAILISAIIGYFFTLPFNLDAVMGILVALFILYSGFSSGKTTLDRLLGTPPEKELIENIENVILSYPEFIGIHDLIVHNYGVGRQFASVHVEVPHNIDVVKCHEQIDLCEKQIFEKLKVSLVIHMDPIDTDDETVAQTKRKLAEAITVIHPNLSLHDFRMTPESENHTNLIFDVVIPSDLKISTNELSEKIGSLAKLINPTFVCVITFDNDFIGK